MRYKLRISFISLLLLFGQAIQAYAEKRIALVLGNAEYTHIASLANPVNDANLMARTLEAAGFSVTKVINADLKEMRKAMITFGRQLRDGADASLFYYAGHGVQVNGENYLVPVTANIEDSEEIEFEGINVNAFLRVMKSSDSDMNIVILDSCRNNPFSASARSIDRGLAPVRAPKGTYIAYSTAPGEVALDGKGKNSYYTAALADAMSTPGLEIARVFRKARESVITATQEKQIPWESSSIVGEFFFVEGDAAEANAVLEGQRQNQQLKMELEAASIWKEIRRSESPEALREFIDKFGSSTSGELARLRLEELNSATIEDPDIKPDQSAEPDQGVNDAQSLALLREDAASRGFDAARKVGTERGWALFIANFGKTGNWRGRALKEIDDIGLSDLQTSRSASQQERGLSLGLEDRKAAQTRLNELGFDVGTVDGVIGRGSRQAIKLFQTNADLQPTGFLDTQTARALGLEVEVSLPDRASSLARKYDPRDLKSLGENTAVVEAARCFFGSQINYRFHNRKLYLAVLREHISWRDARAWAERCRGHLVTISDKQENEIAFSLVADDSRFFRWGNDPAAGWSWKDGPWIGLVQDEGAREPGGGWRWVTKEPIKYQNWAIYHPEEWEPRSDYGRFFQQIQGNKDMEDVRADKWKDSPNNIAHGFIVEFAPDQ